MPLDHQTAKGCRTIAWLAVLMSAVWLTGASATAGFGRPAQRQNPRVPANAGGEARSRITINQKWKFLAEDASGAEQLQFKDERWQEIDLPHTWNKEDTKDDVAGYRRGIGWYRKVINLPQQLKNRKVFLYFEGANQVADVFVNGRSVGRHQGGYTAFIFDISGFVEFDSAGNRNLIAVKVDNSINDDLPPSATADFNLYGGIYRDVWLVTTDPVHFSTTDYASPGIYVDTPEVSAEKARVRIRGTVTNDSDQAQELRVVNTVTDSAGQVVAVTESNLSIAAGAASTFHQITQEIRAPHLWSPETPYLYNSRTQLLRREKTVDEISHSVGIRWFSFDPNQGFSLNGKPYKLRGANRHQDYFGVGNALDDSMHVKDLEAIKDLGLNCVLLAHYPQDPVVLETADRVGLFVWEEIPIVREISTSKEFANNCQVMLTEMIRQHYNHPSIIMWCLMNEIFLRLRTEPGYVPKVVALARALDRLARTEDPTRVTVISANRPSQGDIYNASGLLSIPQVVAWHMYFGWYYGEFAGFGRFVDEEHRRFAQRILFVSEYGADNDARIHSLNPRRGDLSSEWALLYHESYLDQIEARSYLAGAAVWAENDFGSEARGEPLPHVNTKGLLTFNRKPKDVYYLYKAIYSLDPVLRIATHDWLRRTGVPARAEEQGSNRTVVQAVEVYSNLSTVELFANKKSLGRKSIGAERRVTWEVPFVDGLNVLEARGRSGIRELSDRADVRFFYRAANLADPKVPFRELAINVGSSAQYTDAAGLVWEADQPYVAGSWGYIGGAAAENTQNLLDSADDPLFQSSRQGLSQYRLDVPEGRYEVELRFAESRFQTPGERVFSVSINEKLEIGDLDLVKNQGFLRAFAQTSQVDVVAGQGLVITFNASRGESILGALRIKKLK